MSSHDVVQEALRVLDADSEVLVRPTSKFHCSGVIPYCICGTLVYFLLGRTRNGKMLSFTGKSELISHNLYEAPATTAAREFYEESLGCVLSYDQCIAATQACDKNSVLVSTTPKNTLCYTFLVCVPFKRHYSLNFVRTRDFLSFINVHEAHLAEFQEIKGVCFETLNKIRYSWQSSGMSMTECQWNKIRALLPVIEDNVSHGLMDWRLRDEDDDIKYGTPP